jgi:excisionase family DNA binding protein
VVKTKPKEDEDRPEVGARHWADPTVLLTIPEAAERLGVCRSSVYALMDSGELPYLKIGRCRRIQLQAVAQLISRMGGQLVAAAN